MRKSENYGFFENDCSLRPENKADADNLWSRCKYVINLGQGHLLTLTSLLFIHTFKTSSWRPPWSSG